MSYLTYWHWLLLSSTVPKNQKKNTNMILKIKVLSDFFSLMERLKKGTWRWYQNPLVFSSNIIINNFGAQCSTSYNLDRLPSRISIQYHSLSYTGKETFYNDIHLMNVQFDLFTQWFSCLKEYYMLYIFNQFWNICHWWMSRSIYNILYPQHLFL